MNRRETEWAAELAGLTGLAATAGPAGTIDFLARNGLLDLQAVERMMIRRGVERRRREGIGAVEAMRQVAAEHCCSYAKVRAAVYRKD